MGDVTISPSASSVLVPPSGVTVYVTGLPVTPGVGPGGNSMAPSTTTQTHVDKSATLRQPHCPARHAGGRLSGRLIPLIP